MGCSAKDGEEIVSEYPGGEKQETIRYEGEGDAKVIAAKTVYYQNGTIKEEELYAEGVVSSYREYWDNGNIKLRRDYAGSEITTEQAFDSDGAELLTDGAVAEIVAGLSSFKGEPATDDDVVTMETNAGIIKLRLFTDMTPGHADNFKRLANFGFYDGVKFHRIIPGFVIQGGDILSRDTHRGNDGTGDAGYSIDAEFNPRPHVKGTLAMARSQDPHSAGTQFYIALGRLAQLDNNYTVFGEVTEGLEVLDAIAAAPTDQADNPLTPQRILKVRVE
ncbi:peptidylprolyl isomerase [Candidatus Neomarinimicrobiota bacterium]